MTKKNKDMKQNNEKDNKKKQTDEVSGALRFPTIMMEIEKVLFSHHTSIHEALSVSINLAIAALCDSADQIGDPEKTEQVVKGTLEKMSKTVTERVMKYARTQIYTNETRTDADKLFFNQELEN